MFIIGAAVALAVGMILRKLRVPALAAMLASLVAGVVFLCTKSACAPEYPEMRPELGTGWGASLGAVACCIMACSAAVLYFLQKPLGVGAKFRACAARVYGNAAIGPFFRFILGGACLLFAVLAFVFVAAPALNVEGDGISGLSVAFGAEYEGMKLFAFSAYALPYFLVVGGAVIVAANVFTCKSNALYLAGCLVFVLAGMLFFLPVQFVTADGELELDTSYFSIGWGSVLSAICSFIAAGGAFALNLFEGERLKLASRTATVQ